MHSTLSTPTAALNPGSPSTTTPTQLEKLIFWGLCIYMTTLALEGPLRFVLSHLKIATLLYARDLISATVILASMVVARAHFQRQRNQLLLLTYLLITSFFATVLLDNGIFSGLFAIKIFGTFLFGIAAYTAVLTHPKQFKLALMLMFGVTLTGVVINRFYGAFPWEGGLFESAFGTSEISRVWWISGGERRLAGFTRASPLAAGIIAITGGAMLITAKNYWVRLLLFVAGIAGIYLTTSKGLIIAYMAVAAISAFPMQSKLRSMSGVFFAIAFFILGILAPLISWITNPGIAFQRSSPRILSSFADRISNSWPDTINGFTHWYNWLVGQGLGGIGLPALFSGKVSRMSVVDNLHLFLMANFGLIGTTLFVLFFVRIMRNADSHRDASRAAFAVGIIALGYGIVSNIADDAFSPIAIGIAWGLMSQPKEMHKATV